MEIDWANLDTDKQIVVYSKGNRKDMVAKFGDKVTYFNTTRSPLSNIKGMKFSQMTIVDRDVCRNIVKHINKYHMITTEKYLMSLGVDEDYVVKFKAYKEECIKGKKCE